MSETNLYRPIHPGTLSGARTTSLDSGIDSNSGRTSASGSTRGSSSFRDRNQHVHAPGGAPSVWFSAPDLRVARAAEADVVEPESLAQQRARARFFDDTSTDMRRGWYPVMMSNELRGGSKGDVVGMFLLGDPIVLWRDAEDIPVCLEDRCAHRNAPLSLGRRTHDGKLECAYDGWTYDSEGAVTYIPALLADRDIPSNACARRYPTVEMDGLVWVWPGDPSQPAYDMHVRLPPSIAPGSTPHFSATGSKGISVAAGGDEIEEDDKSSKSEERWGKTFTQIMDLDVDNGLLVEWLLDFSHTSYTSQNLLGKALKPAALQCDINFGTDSTAVVANVHRPETNEPPVELKFIPPCHVQMTVEYNGYKAHQTFHCVPTQKGHTRLIFRHNRNYWTWLDNLPFVGALYNRRWIKTVLQSYNLLLGIQERLKAGARPWNAPIQADLLPRYYREWWKRAVKKEAWFNG
ncbi:hypothetical protein HDU85_007381 [Gaertneriomyces sp. JEL0708]|nr:hypothetical protein HDU85_007381 [Gaertneriomyces sp. JEL0708]